MTSNILAATTLSNQSSTGLSNKCTWNWSIQPVAHVFHHPYPIHTKSLARALLFVLQYPIKRSYFRTMTYYVIHVLPHINQHTISYTLPIRKKDESNPFAKCQSDIVVKIRIIVFSSNSSMETTCKCRTNRDVMSFRPPPGGPIAPINSCSMKRKFW
jgi:hypothetical protein